MAYLFSFLVDNGWNLTGIIKNHYYVNMLLMCRCSAAECHLYIFLLLICRRSAAENNVTQQCCSIKQTSRRAVIY
jgi:predicted nuclease of restriction endonuclease-like (RecB) superfamily